ncbi:Bacterial type II secretion system protein F domain protein [Lignipirellula cremea]|uniref:Bacterial type II secretion system protein F domain protein n=2 Tax=Lignipirellula cremea TaxID=2528010 RepID=A0A518E459_9BACT|nr:Bacterial type II secretion system protein F domain protein [Lignipirellula cremea]
MGLYFLVGMPWPYCVSLAVIASLLGSQFESFLATRKEAKLEAQLADAVDIMVGALGAGAGVAGALEAALQETHAPLRGQLEEILGRIRLGDQPQSVFQNLSERIPLETFLLFASTLAVHWEVGGSLAPTLATVGRTIRDRIDISRRIRSNTAQSTISTMMMVGLTYFIALVVYNNGPEQMKAFLGTSIGSFFAAGSMLLQAVGIVWMSYISRMKF